MIERIFVLPNIIILIILAVAGFVLGLIIGLTKGEGGDSALRGLEAAVLAFVGGLLASAFISFLIGIDNNSPEACLAVGWGFFLIPGIVDTIPYFLGKQILTAPDTLIMLAIIVGGITGMMGGIWRVYNWLGLGWLSFPLDVTWALAGSTIGCLLHLINFAWGRHAGSVDNETRENAHHYRSGFGLKPRFAFTQGPVMSNLDYGAGDDLYRHEKTHVWQNRIFGPVYTLSYIGWMVVFFIPALIASPIAKENVGAGIQTWCYFNNPWEAWAYTVQHQDRDVLDGAAASLLWPGWAIILSGLLFIVGFLAMLLYIIFSVW